MGSPPEESHSLDLGYPTGATKDTAKFCRVGLVRAFHQVVEKALDYRNLFSRNSGASVDRRRRSILDGRPAFKAGQREGAHLRSDHLFVSGNPVAHYVSYAGRLRVSRETR
jgi:hypothetical protein